MDPNLTPNSQPPCAPVVVFVYKRPIATARVMHAVATARPSRVFIIADGPKSATEVSACRAAREAAEATSQSSVVTRIYSDSNLGLCQRVKTGLDQVFEEVEHAIILEDDCVPKASFFRSCTALLNELATVSRVFQIGGFNYAPQLGASTLDFVASKYCLIWGWATWRRAWQSYRRAEASMLRHADDALANYCTDPIERTYWAGVFDLIRSGKFSDWAAEWMLYSWSQGGISLLPKHPTISNIGFDSLATHTTGARPYWAAEGQELPGSTFDPALRRDVEAERIVFDHVFGGWYSREGKLWRFLFHHARFLFRRLRGDPSGWEYRHTHNS